MTRPPLSLDTPHEIERLQLEGWRAMSPAQKAEIITGLTQSAFELARAGVKHRYPDASPASSFSGSRSSSLAMISPAAPIPTPPPARAA